MPALATALARASYYFRRIRETSASTASAIVWSRLKPHVYRPAYAIRRIRGARPDAHQQSALALFSREFGARLAADALSPRRDEVLERAQAALAGEIPCLGYGARPAPRGPLWLTDVFHGYAWSADYFADCDFLQAERRVDVKVVWEFSRLQWLPWLAEGAQVDHERRDRFVQAFLETVDDWSVANPLGYGPNWTCGMEVSIRAVNLVMGLALVHGLLPPGASGRIVTVLEEHLQFIHRFPEISDVRGNHYLADLMGPAVIEGVLRPGSSSHAAAVLAFAEAADAQFDSEGAHFEYATVYHRLCLDMVAIVTALAHRSSLPTTGSLLAVMDRALRFADHVSAAEGLLPLIGDSDSGRVLWFGENPRRYGAAAELFFAVGGQDYRRGPQEHLGAWFCAIAGVDRPTAEPAAPPRRAYAELNGVAVARSGPWTAVMRCGPQGLCGRAPHDHDDALNVWLFIGDEDVLVDEGCHSYTLDPAIRKSYIASTRHNVVTPGDEERHPLTAGSIFATVRDAPVGVARPLEGSAAPAFTATLDVPAGSPFVTCGRDVRLEACGVEVQDHWSWTADRPWCSRWRLAPAWQVHRESPGRFVLTHAVTSRRLSVDFILSDDAEAQEFAYGFAEVYGAESPGVGIAAFSSSPARYGQAGVRITLLDGLNVHPGSGARGH